MVLLVLEYFLHEIGYSWCKGVIVIFPITIDDYVAMLDGGLVTVKWDFFNIFFDVLNVVPWVELKKLDKVFLFEGTHD